MAKKSKKVVEEEVELPHEDDHDADENSAEEYYDEDEEMEDEGMDEVAAAAKPSFDPRFALPTVDEQTLLRDAQGNKELFKSNLLRLEIEELLSQVWVNESEEKAKQVKDFLFHVKSTIEKIKPKKEVSQESLKGVSLMNWDSAKPVKIDFEAPTEVNVVGSYLLETMMKPKYYIDLSITIPESCFTRKDYLNHRYFDKRLLYLHVVGAALSKSKLVSNVEYEGFIQDTSKPVLLVHAKELKHVIRILPVVKDSTFPIGRFKPVQSNVRPLDYFGSEIVNSATPCYNMKILEDVESSSFFSHLKLLNKVKKKCPAFTQVCVLIKVWCRVRGLSKDFAPDVFNEFLLQMLLAHLIMDERINLQMSNQQMFRTLMTFLSRTDLEKTVLRMRPSFGTLPVVEEGFDDESMRVAFPICFIGPCGKLNLAWRVSISAWKSLREQAGLTCTWLTNQDKLGGKDVFDALFATKVDVWQQYDKYFVVQCPERPEKGQLEANHGPLICDLSWDQYLRHRVETIFHNGFVATQRAKTVRVVVNWEACNTWKLRSAPPTRNVLVVCLLLDLDHSFKSLDKGPSADEPAKAAAFRAFWGEKAELRRFKDGSILETLDWTMFSKDRVSEHIASHLLKHQFPFSIIYKGNKKLSDLNSIVIGSELNNMLTILDQQHELKTQVSMAEQDPYGALFKAYQGLVDRVRHLELPLSVIGIHAADSALRYASSVRPSPHPLCFGEEDEARTIVYDLVNKNDSKKRKPITVTKRVSRLTEAIQVIIEMESSGKWPDDLDAIASMKTGFYVQIAEVLDKSHPGRQRTIPCRKYLDILTDGYAFRLTIRLDKERNMMINPRPFIMGSVSRAAGQAMRQGDPNAQPGKTGVEAKDEKAEKMAQARTMERQTVRIPLLHQQLHALHTGIGAHTMGSVVRLVKLWFSAHSLFNHISEEAIELLVASIYVDPQPYTSPNSVATGFLRFLHLLSTWDWENEPLIVSMGDRPVNHGKMVQIFSAERERGAAPPMYIVTPDDVEQICYWTSKEKPSQGALDRMMSIAKDSLELLRKLYGMHASGENDNVAKTLWQAVFQSSPESDPFYDVVIELNPVQTLRDVNISKQSAAKLYKNLTVKEKVYVGCCPVRFFVEQIEQNFPRHLLSVYYDPYRGNYVCLKYDPDFHKPVPLRIAAACCAMPASTKGKNKSEKDSEKMLVTTNEMELLASIAELGGDLVLSMAKTSK